MNRQEQVEQIKARFPGITAGQDAAGNTVLTVSPEVYAGLCTYLQKEAEPAFDYLSSLSGVDYPDRFEVVLHLLSFADQRRVTVKAPLDKANPEIPSVSAIWPSANWHEREAYDLFGIRFAGHPNLKRILLVDDFPGHPLRKDYQKNPA